DSLLYKPRPAAALSTSPASVCRPCYLLRQGSESDARQATTEMGGGMMVRLGLGLLLLALLLPPQLEAEIPPLVPSGLPNLESSAISVLQCSISVLVLSLSFLLHLYC
ncbi:hypothetical protein H1C71_033192, partial [Ictidomys tridecemlineatus]